MSDTRPLCECGLLEQLAAEPASPLGYDAKLAEYSLVVGRSTWLIEFCFSCGGRLPPSRRGELFTTPSSEEVAALRQAMDGLKSVDQVIARLGEPDDVVNRPSEPSAHPKEIVWRRQLSYSRLWTTLNLVVLE